MMMNRTFISGNCRFSVISETLIRVEVSSDKRFVDEETLLAKRRGIPARFSVSESESRLVIETPHIRLIHNNDGNFPHQDNLRAEIVYRDGIVRWFYRKEPSVPPVGIFSRDGWFILEDTGTPVLRDGWLTNRPESHKKDFYLFAYGADYRQALRDLALLSGDFVLPRKKTLGFWYGSEKLFSSEEVLRIIGEYEAYRFPLDVFVMDRTWHTGFPGEPTGYTWNEDRFGDCSAFVAGLSKRGISFSLCDRPFGGIRPEEEAYGDFMRAMCCSPEAKELKPFRAGDSAYMRCFFSQVQQRLTENGVDFFCFDSGSEEYSSDIPGILGQKLLPWLKTLYYENSRKTGLRGQVSGAFGGIGDHKRPLCFSGSSCSGWDSFAQEVESFVSSAASGNFFRGLEIGGVHPAEKDPEFFLRRVQFGVTCAALCFRDFGGDTVDCRPWLWGEKNCDSLRKMTALRAELAPYRYSTAYACYDNQTPFLRPLSWEDSENKENGQCLDSYYFGDSFFVSPITEAGKDENVTVTKTVRLPEGQWVDWFSGERYQGGGSAEICCGRDSFPFFVRVGVPVPMQPYADYAAGEPLKNLMVKIFDCDPGRTGTFTLYEDDGVSEKYMDGAFLTTDLCYERLENEINLSFLPAGNVFDGQVSSRNILIEINGLCDSYRCDSPKVKVVLDTENCRTLIKVGKVNPRAEIHICLRKETPGRW